MIPKNRKMQKDKKNNPAKYPKSRLRHATQLKYRWGTGRLTGDQIQVANGR